MKHSPTPSNLSYQMSRRFSQSVSQSVSQWNNEMKLILPHQQTSHTKCHANPLYEFKTFGRTWTIPLKWSSHCAAWCHDNDLDL